MEDQAQGLIGSVLVLEKIVRLFFIFERVLSNIYGESEFLYSCCPGTSVGDFIFVGLDLGVFLMKIFPSETHVWWAWPSLTACRAEKANLLL
jgi:hypothetical protein